MAEVERDLESMETCMTLMRILGYFLCEADSLDNT